MSFIPFLAKRNVNLSVGLCLNLIGLRLIRINILFILKKRINITARAAATFASLFFSCAISVSLAIEQGSVSDYFSPFESDVRLEHAFYKVEQAQRVILKTDANTTVADVLDISRNIQKAQLIFSGDSFEYYLLMISNDFESTYKQVLENPLALLAQPDMYLKKNTFFVKSA